MNIFRRLIASFLILAVFIIMPYAQVDTTKQDSVKSKTILIAKGESYFEKTVSKFLSDTLIRKGCTVKIVSIKKLDEENSNLYGSVIVFGAITSSQNIEPSVRQFLDNNYGSSNMMVITISGEKWNSKYKSVDAIAAATKTLNPKAVTAKILKALESTDKSHGDWGDQKD